MKRTKKLLQQTGRKYSRLNFNTLSMYIQIFSLLVVDLRPLINAGEININ